MLSLAITLLFKVKCGSLHRVSVGGCQIFGLRAFLCNRLAAVAAAGGKCCLVPRLCSSGANRFWRVVLRLARPAVRARFGGSAHAASRYRRRSPNLGRLPSHTAERRSGQRGAFCGQMRLRQAASVETVAGVVSGGLSSHWPRWLRQLRAVSEVAGQRTRGARCGKY